MELSLYRGDEILRQGRTLPAALYNLLHILLARQGDGCLFVPIRSMQYLAVADTDEVVFVDGHTKHLIDVAWRNFQPRARHSLEDPVPFDAVIYTEAGHAILQRLQGELAGALAVLEHKARARGGAAVLDFSGRRRQRE